MPNAPKLARRDVPSHADASPGDLEQRVGNLEVSARESQIALRDMHTVFVDVPKYLNDVVPKALYLRRS